MKVLFGLFIIWTLNGCASHFINERTSEVCYIDNTCLDENAWNFLEEEYSIELNDLSDSLLADGVGLIKNQPFATHIYYFKNDPSELIAVAKDHYSVRYVYSPELSSDVLDGFSQELDVDERKRIMRRLYAVLNKFQCDEGVERSKEFIDAIEL